MIQPNAFVVNFPSIVSSQLASTNLTYTIPESIGEYRFKTLIIELETDATVANRELVLVVTTKNSIVKTFATSGRAQVASEGILYAFGATGAPYTAPLLGRVHVPLQGFITQPGDIIILSVTNAGVADFWGPEGQIYFEAVKYG